MSNADHFTAESAEDRWEAERALREPDTQQAGMSDDAPRTAEGPGEPAERLELATRSAQLAADQLEARLKLAARMLKCLDRLSAQSPPAGAPIAAPSSGHPADPDGTAAAALQRAECVMHIVEEAERNVASMLFQAATILEKMNRAQGDECPLPAAEGDSIGGDALPFAAASEAAGATEQPGPECDAEAAPTGADGPAEVPADATFDALADETAELMAMNRELESQLAAVQEQYDRIVALQSIHDPSEDLTTRVLATVSDEIRTPVETMARLVDLFAETGLDARQRDYLADARSAVRALQELMKSVPTAPAAPGIPGISGAPGIPAATGIPAVGDMSEAPPGTLPSPVQRFELDSLVGEVAGELTQAAQRKGVRITSGVESDEPALFGDRPRLRQALLYALNRAVQCAAHGEIMFRARAARRPERSVAVQFTIIGIGAAPDAHRTGEAPMLIGSIDPARGEDSAEPGLGLTIARRLVESLGGVLGITATDDQRFEISLTAELRCDGPEHGETHTYPRLPQEGLESNFGRVIDLSIDGMRITCSKVPPEDEVLDVELKDPDGVVSLKAQLVWSRRVGFRRHEVGLRFIEVTRALAADLTRVSLNHRVPTTVAG